MSKHYLRGKIPLTNFYVKDHWCKRDIPLNYSGIQIELNYAYFMSLVTNDANKKNVNLVFIYKSYYLMFVSENSVLKLQLIK